MSNVKSELRKVGRKPNEAGGHPSRVSNMYVNSQVDRGEWWKYRKEMHVAGVIYDSGSLCSDPSHKNTDKWTDFKMHKYFTFHFNSMNYRLVSNIQCSRDV